MRMGVHYYLDRVGGPRALGCYSEKQNSRKLSIAVIVITSPNIRIHTLSHTSEGNKTGRFTLSMLVGTSILPREAWPVALLLTRFDFPVPAWTST